MIKIENVVLPSAEQWQAVIRGMRNPLNSWNKSDTYVKICRTGFHEDRPCDPKCAHPNCSGPYINKKLGANDLALMKRLVKAGTDHRKFMRMIPVYLDVTAPLYFYKEIDTYKVGTVCNSCSTMHKIHAKEFTLDDFSIEHLNQYDRSLYKEIIGHLNRYRNIYINGGFIDYPNARRQVCKPKDKDIWYSMIQLLPSSYNQKRTIMLNYEVLANMYKSRKNHKLDEWVEFCKWIETLPYSELITGEFDV